MENSLSTLRILQKVLIFFLRNSPKRLQVCTPSAKSGFCPKKMQIICRKFKSLLFNTSFNTPEGCVSSGRLHRYIKFICFISIFIYLVNSSIFFVKIFSDITYFFHPLSKTTKEISETIYLYQRWKL